MMDKYIGIPFVHGGSDPQTGLDCYRLIEYVVKSESGKSIPSYDVHVDGSPGSIRRVHRQIKQAMKEWTPVSTPAPFSKDGPVDVVVIRTGGLTFHVGLVVGKREMLHTSDKKTESCIERFTDPLYANRIIGYFRCEI